MIWLAQLSVQLAASTLAVPVSDGSLAQVQQICSGAPSFEQIESRSEALGWTKDEAIAEQYLSYLKQIAPPDDQPDGQLLAMKGKAGDFILVSGEDWMGCAYRNPVATSLPTAQQWHTLFNIGEAGIADEMRTDALAMIAFEGSDGSGPSYAIFMSDAASGVTDQTIGLTIVYEYTKEAD